MRDQRFHQCAIFLLVVSTRHRLCFCSNEYFWIDFFAGLSSDNPRRCGFES
ncbi:hypothetical protein SynNOUM97013_02822 [Synechococcus sp. NOUM97013]|nr:hypothetical protein SynNOUM97013_02822 [Synechococcus sp. NOUM97013]